MNGKSGDETPQILKQKYILFISLYISTTNLGKKPLPCISENIISSIIITEHPPWHIVPKSPLLLSQQLEIAFITSEHFLCIKK